MSEVARHRIYEGFRDHMGEEVAGLVMDYLPPSRWEDLATKQDLAATEGRLRGEMREMEHRLLAAFRGEINAAITSQTRWTLVTVISAVTAMAALFRFVPAP